MAPRRAANESRALAFFTTTAVLSGLQFGYDTGVISGALLKVSEAFSLSDTLKEVVVASTTAGALVSALLSSQLADWMGRRLAIMGSAAVFVAGCLILAFASSVPMLVAGRTVVGVAIGLSSSVTPVYLAESARAQDRGFLVAANSICITGGQFFASVLDGALQNEADGWRLMLGLGAIPAVLQVVLFLFGSETPRYLALKGRLSDAWNSLSSIRGLPKTPLPEIDDTDLDDEGGSGITDNDADDTAHVAPDPATRQLLKRGHDAPSTVEHEDSVTEFRAMVSSIRSEHSRVAMSPLQLLCSIDPPLRRAVVLAVSAQVAQQLAGVNIAMYYSASVLQQAGFSTAQAIWLAAGVAFVNFGGTVASMSCVERIGRRPLMIASAAVSTLTLIVCAAAFVVRDSQSPLVAESVAPCTGYPLCAYCVTDSRCGFQFPPSDPGAGWCVPGTQTGPVQDYSNHSVAGWEWAFQQCPFSPTQKNPIPLLDIGWWVFSATVAFLIGFAPGLGTVPWVLQADLFPTKARAAGNSLATAANWTANLIVSASFLSLVTALRAWGAFFFFAFFAAVSTVWFWAVLPETKGKSLEAISRDLAMHRVACI
jgi:MFS transporter, SP family, solute carrier family 2 (myo-inositol transporter), member 13